MLNSEWSFTTLPNRFINFNLKYEHRTNDQHTHFTLNKITEEHEQQR